MSDTHGAVEPGGSLGITKISGTSAPVLTQWGMTEDEWNEKRDARLSTIVLIGLDWVEDGMTFEVQPGDVLTIDNEAKTIRHEFGPDRMPTFLGHDHSLCEPEGSRVKLPEGEEADPLFMFTTARMDGSAVMLGDLSITKDGGPLDERLTISFRASVPDSIDFRDGSLRDLSVLLLHRCHRGCPSVTLDGAPEGLPLHCVLDDEHDGWHDFRYDDGNASADYR